MGRIDVYDLKRAVKNGKLEFFVQKDSIYVNDCQSGTCIKLGTVKGEPVDEEEKSI